MLKTASPQRDIAQMEKAVPHPRYLEAFRWMLQTRVFEEKLTSLYRGGMITGGVYVGRGQEAVSAACGMFLQKGDVFAPLIRDQAGRAAFGEPLMNVARTYLGSRQGTMRGRDGNIHRGYPETGQLAMISHLGAMIAVVAGKLLAKRMKGEKGFVGLTTIGEGGMQTGATHEGMNIAAVEKVPLVLVASNNHCAYSTPNDREFVCANLVDRAQGYGYEGHTVDGTDLAACSRSNCARGGTRARRAARRNWSSLRFCDSPATASTMTPVMFHRKCGRNRSRADCVLKTEKLILDQRLAGRGDAQTMACRIFRARSKEAVATAQVEAGPVGHEEDWCALSTRRLVDMIS